MKIFKVHFSNGERWAIPACAIAAHYEQHCTEKPDDPDDDDLRYWAMSMKWQALLDLGASKIIKIPEAYDRSFQYENDLCDYEIIETT